MRRILLFYLLIALTQIAKAQQGFGTSTPDPSSVIDMVANNKGVLFPRVALTGTTDVVTVSSPSNALTVFNTSTVSDVTPGYYYYRTAAPAKWIRLNDVNTTPTFFYAPSIVLPTVNVSLPANITYSAGVFTVDLYAIYNYQYTMAGNITGASRTAIKSPNATTIPVQSVGSLEYFVTYFDNTVFDPNSITLSDTGILTYKILAGAVVTEKTYMNIVFKVK